MSKLTLEDRCTKQVHDGGRWPSFHRCNRRAVRDGRCNLHHPDAMKARSDAAIAKWRAKLERENAPFEEIARLRAELDAWKARMKALTGSDQPDAAGNAVISLRAELESAREAIRMLAPADEEDHWFNPENFDFDLWFESPAVHAACEGKR